jgi:very-short-patch-repair endonuclease
MKLHYDPALRALARELRKNSTLSEILLWQHLKAGQRFGFDFNRQKPIDRYIVDFFSHELLLAVEIEVTATSSRDRKMIRDRRDWSPWGFDFCDLKTIK